MNSQIESVKIVNKSLYILVDSTPLRPIIMMSARFYVGNFQPFIGNCSVLID